MATYVATDVSTVTSNLQISDMSNESVPSSETADSSTSCQENKISEETKSESINVTGESFSEIGMQETQQPQ